MNTNIFKIILLGLSSLSTMPVAYADDWQMLDRYQVRYGLAKDTTTGLMWMRCSMGQNWDMDDSTCKGDVASFSWDQAMDVSKHFEYAGYSDWRLPSSEELKALVQCSSTETRPYKSEIKADTVEVKPDKTDNKADKAETKPEKTATKPEKEDGRTACAGWYSSPTIASEAFPETPSRWFWSSSGHEKSADSAWFVEFTYGYEDFTNKTDKGAVRLVRKGR